MMEQARSSSFHGTPDAEVNLLRALKIGTDDAFRQAMARKPDPFRFLPHNAFLEAVASSSSAEQEELDWFDAEDPSLIDPHETRYSLTLGAGCYLHRVGIHWFELHGLMAANLNAPALRVNERCVIGGVQLESGTGLDLVRTLILLELHRSGDPSIRLENLFRHPACAPIDTARTIRWMLDQPLGPFVLACPPETGKGLEVELTHAADDVIFLLAQAPGHDECKGGLPQTAHGVPLSTLIMRNHLAHIAAHERDAVACQKLDWLIEAGFDPLAQGNDGQGLAEFLAREGLARACTRVTSRQARHEMKRMVGAR